MSRPFIRMCLALLPVFGVTVGVHAEEKEKASGFLEAEQFVHSHLYDGMLQVWATDRRSWNLLLNVHACGGIEQQEKLNNSYEVGKALFSQSILNYADGQPEFNDPQKQAVLSDVAQLAYRLFSASYAHGYARHVQQMDRLDAGIQQELCGAEEKVNAPPLVEYSDTLNWQVSTSDVDKESLLYQAKNIVEQHARHGYHSFNQLLKQQYENFDALVYSHAYQNPEAYDVLFFTVNDYENVEAYQEGVDSLSGIKRTQHEEGEIPHADFAYLVLASGYHWGTLSVLAMLEEEFPRLHNKVKSKANAHILRVTEKLAKTDTSEDLG